MNCKQCNVDMLSGGTQTVRHSGYCPKCVHERSMKYDAAIEELRGCRNTMRDLYLPSDGDEAEVKDRLTAIDKLLEGEG